MALVAAEKPPGGGRTLRVQRVNRALLDLLGWQEVELRGRDLRELLAEELQPDAATGRDLTCRRRDGAFVPVRASMALALDDGGKPLLYALQLVAVPAAADDPRTANPHAPATPRDLAGAAHALAAPAEAVERVHPLAGRHVLVVDDDEDLRTWMIAVLRAAGARVTGAGGVAEARARAEADTAATEEALIGEANVAACKRERLRTGTPERGQDDRPTKSKREMNK
jgi:hypothetical protein